MAEKTELNERDLQQIIENDIVSRNFSVGGTKLYTKRRTPVLTEGKPPENYGKI